MINVMVRLVAGLAGGDPKRRCIATVEAESYTPETLDRLIPELLNGAVAALELRQLSDLKKMNPEVGVCITSDEGQRAVFNVSAETVALVSAAGAGIDFDPYISDAANPCSDKPPSW
jgi:hypothetical protein